LFRSLPNLLTASRLILVPVIAERLARARYAQALALILLAGVTDGLDGWLARRFAWTTRAGAWLDPVADKALLITVYILLGLRGVIPAWLALLIPLRDLFILSMVGVGLMFTRVRDFPPSPWGKLSTIVQIFAALALLADAAAGSALPRAAANALIYITAAITIWSGVDYGRRGLARLRQLRIDDRESRR